MLSKSMSYLSRQTCFDTNHNYLVTLSSHIFSFDFMLVSLSAQVIHSGDSGFCNVQQYKVINLSLV